MENTGLNAYLQFHSLKLHFTSKYDYFKYGGKVKLNAETFMSDKHRYSYYKLSREYSTYDLMMFYVANFLENRIKWVGDLNTPEAKECYTKWLKRTQALTYIFNQETDEAFSKGLKGLLTVKNGQHPRLLTYYLQKQISPETLVIANALCGFFKDWEEKIDDDLIWPEIHNRLTKYAPFLLFDKPKFKEILLANMKNWT